MFITVSRFHSRQIFAKEANSLPLDWSVIKSYTRQGSSNACKYKSRMEVNDSDIHFNLLQNKINYCRERVYSAGPISTESEPCEMIFFDLAKNKMRKLNKIFGKIVIFETPVSSFLFSL